MSELKGQSNSKDTHKLYIGFFFMLAILMVQCFCPVGLSQSNAIPKIANTSGNLHKPLKQKSILEAILAIISRKRIPGSSRTTNQFCPIAPAVIESENVVWSDRPLFAWRGTIASLQVRPYVADGVFADQLLVWEPTADELGQGFVSSPVSLKPGQRYDWQVIYAAAGVDQSVKVRRTYQVMAAPERDRISEALSALDARLQSEGATEDEVRLARAHYFLEQDLWSDALQQIYLIRNHGPEFLELSRMVGDRACQPKFTGQVSNQVR